LELLGFATEGRPCFNASLLLVLLLLPLLLLPLLLLLLPPLLLLSLLSHSQGWL
jgi:hypothetical protein